MNRADEANELNPFFKRFISHDFSRRHRQIRGVLNRASAEDDDFQRAFPLGGCVYLMILLRLRFFFFFGLSDILLFRVNFGFARY